MLAAKRGAIQDRVRLKPGTTYSVVDIIRRRPT
jgi:hypothetical protein